jgi:3-oxoacyl-[acyl-carrier protein] reductase
MAKGVNQIRRLFTNGVPAKRFGQPSEFGAMCAFLCSQHAGYVVGQNILVDGGAYPGTF